MKGAFLAVLCFTLIADASMASWPIPDNAFKEKPIFHVVRDLMEGKEEMVSQALTTGFISHKIFTTYEEAESRSRMLIEQVMLRDDSPGCTGCTGIVDILKTLGGLPGGYNALATLITNVCLNITGQTDEIRGIPLCNGTIDHQGPHLFAAVMGSEPAKFCEFINACEPSTLVEDKTSDFQYQNEVLPDSKRRGHHQRKLTGKRKPRDVDYENAIKVVQLADIHVEPTYGVGSPTTCGLNVCCQWKWDDHMSSGTAGHWGDYNCNIPQRTMRLFLEKVNDYDPDFIIYSGDSPPHTMWDETQESQLECTSLLAQDMAEYLPNQTVYNNLGNHEMYPTNLYSRELCYTVSMSEAFVDLWRPLSNMAEDEWDRFRDGGFYSTMAAPGLRIISFNTNFMYTFNWYNVLNWEETELPSEMNAFIEERLTDARTSGEKVILIGHHPPGIADYLISASRWFKNLVIKYSDVIVLHVSGHTHTDQFRMVIDDDGIAQHVVHVAPSVSTGGTKNPSMRIFYLDPVTFEPLDYDHHYFDLREASDEEENPPEIVLSYRASEEYGMDDLFPESYRQLTDRMETDQELMNKHHGHRNAQADADPPNCGSDDCRVTLLCRCRTASYDDYTQCVESYTPPKPTDSPTQPPGPEDAGSFSTSSLGVILFALLLSLL